MTAPFEEMAELDRLIHEPARLSILTALSACASADFLYLQRLTGLTKGNLSGHLAKLEDAGLLRVHKEFAGKMPKTTLHLTHTGKAAIKRHWEKLEQLSEQARQWQPEHKRA